MSKKKSKKYSERLSYKLDLKPRPQSPPRPWRITWEGQSWSESEVTGEHLAVIGLMTGVDSWESLDLGNEISPAKGPIRLMWMITALVAVAAGTSDPESLGPIIQKVRTAPAEQLLAALSFD